MAIIAGMKPEYRKAYNRGWAASERASVGALDRADARREVEAWYDGYLDNATGREKFHMATCTDHDNCP